MKQRERQKEKRRRSVQQACLKEFVGFICSSLVECADQSPYLITLANRTTRKMHRGCGLSVAYCRTCRM